MFQTDNSNNCLTRQFFFRLLAKMKLRVSNCGFAPKAYGVHLFIPKSAIRNLQSKRTELICAAPRRKRFLHSAFYLLPFLFVAGCSMRSSNRFQGYIEGEYVYVASPLGGALQNLAVARGDEVQAGQLLFQLERRSEADAARQASNNLAQAKANLALSQAEFARREKLRKDHGVISEEELDQARAQRDADQAQVAAQTAALAKSNWSFDQKEQFAPTNAYVQDTLYRVGEWVATGNPVVQLLPPANLKVRFFVPETILPEIKPGQTVRVTFDGEKRDYSATVNYISTQAEFTPPVIYSEETRAKLVYMIEAKFSPADAADLRPGQPVDVELK
jgi:HlyD family secretion protein